MRTFLLCALSCASLLACSGNREDRLGTAKSPAEADGGQVEVPPAIAEPPGAPARSAQLGLSGGKSRSAHYRAHIVLDFPHAASTTRAPHYSARFTRGARP